MLVDIAAALARLIALGGSLDRPIERREYGRIANMADPFGNGFDVIEFSGSGYSGRLGRDPPVRGGTLGYPPQVGHSGSRGTRTLWKAAPNASYMRSDPERLSPSPRISFSTSVAWSVPMTPTTAPRMPAVSQRGTLSGGGGSRKRQR